MIAFRVTDWNTRYECAQSRKIVGPLPWVKSTTAHDVLEHRRLMRLDDGIALLGAFHLIVGAAAKCPTRGVLSDAHGPLTAADLAMMTGGPESFIAQALETLSDPKLGIGWIERGVVVGDRWEPSGSMLPLGSQHAPDTNKQTDKETNKHDFASHRTNPADLSREKRELAQIAANAKARLVDHETGVTDLIARQSGGAQ